MKTRNGFVSNSSSSSFIIGLPRSVFSNFGKFGTPEDICSYSLVDYLYPKGSSIRKKGITYKYADCPEMGKDLYAICEIIKLSLRGTKPLTKSQAVSIVYSGGFSGMPSWNDSQKESRRLEIAYYDKHKKSIFSAPNDDTEVIAWQKVEDKENKTYSKACRLAAKKLVDGMWPLWKGYKVFTLEFSDNDGQLFSMLEHGNTFSKIAHISVSRH